MASQLKNSKTKENLMKAFAGESQARNRYTFAAEEARKEGLYAVSQIFLFTAEQERAHAERFYELLKEMAGETIEICGGYPVDKQDSTEELLYAAQHNEYEEHDDVYKNFGDKAKEEGFTQIANSFHMIADIEKFHGDRFGKFAQFLEDKNLFVSDVETGWICLKCGYIHWGKEAPKKCPVCSHDQGYFIRLELSPFAH